MNRPIALYCNVVLLFASSCVCAEAQTIRTVAGGGLTDGGLATRAPISSPMSVAVDAAGNVYIADSNHFRIRRVALDGTITTVAGNGTPGYAGDKGPATSAQLGWPIGVALDTLGNLYIADAANSAVRKVSMDGTITTIAGNGTEGYSGDNGPGSRAQLSHPDGVAIDAAGRVYIADYYNNVIRKVSTSGTITTVAGNTKLNHPIDVAVDSAGNLFVVEQDSIVKKVSTNGTVTTIAGNGQLGYTGDNGPAKSSGLCYPNGIALDAAGNLYIADGCDNRIRAVSTTGTITTVAGNGSSGYSGDGGAATSAELDNPQGVAVDADGNIYIAELDNRIRKVATDGTIVTVAGNGDSIYIGDGGAATSAELGSPPSLAVGADGNIYIADTDNNRIRKLDSNGTITTVLGDTFPSTYDLNRPFGVAVDALGNVYAADTYNKVVRKNSAVIGLPFDFPTGIAVDIAGNVYVADTSRNVIWELQPGIGMIVIAGYDSTGGYSGDGGLATRALLNSPWGVAVDAHGNLYIADSGNDCIRKVDSSGTITTVIGGGITYAPHGVAVDASGSLYIADTGHDVVRKMTNGTITTIAGTGTRGYSGDGGAATSAELHTPQGVAIDADGNVYIADTGNSRIREVLLSEEIFKDEFDSNP